MGCDIHSVAQIKNKDQWITVQVRVAGDQRNYDTFGILANVRNGYGFAGCDTGDGFEPISEPKGLPKDFVMDDGSHLVLDRINHSNEEKSSVWMGDHSYSWHTLNDIQQYLKKVARRKTKKRGFIDEKTYLKIRTTGESPTNWYGNIDGSKIIKFSDAEYDRLENANDLPLPGDKKVYIQYQWSVGYTDSSNIESVVKDLQAIAKQYGVGPEDVRYVFGFDS